MERNCSTIYASGLVKGVNEIMFDKNDELMQMPLVKLGERKILEIIASKLKNEDTKQQSGIIKGIGDDCAILDIADDEYLVTTVDTCPTPVICILNEETNYKYYGWYTMLISLSDLASMGAKPKGMLISIEAPNNMKLWELMRYYDGILEASRKFGCPIIGGNIKDSDRFNCSSTALGVVKKNHVLERDQAKIDDYVIVIGDMGLFWSGVINRMCHLDLELSEIEKEKLNKNLVGAIPRLTEGQILVENSLANCAMDCSDGLTACFYEIAQSAKNIDIQLDLSNVTVDHVVEKVAQASGIEIEKILLSWGDWQLVCTTSKLNELKEVFEKLNTPIHIVGKVVEGSGNVLINKDGKNGKLNYVASERFDESSFFSFGLDAYLEKMKKLPLTVGDI